MADSLEKIVDDLGAGMGQLKVQVEKLYGKIDGTDFSDEYAILDGVLARAKNFLSVQKAIEAASKKAADEAAEAASKKNDELQ